MSGVEAVAWVKPGDINNLGFEDGHSWPGIFRHETDEYSEPLYRKYDIDRLQTELADAAGEAAFLGKCASTLRAQLEAAEAELSPLKLLAKQAQWLHAACWDMADGTGCFISKESMERFDEVFNQIGVAVGDIVIDEEGEADMFRRPGAVLARAEAAEAECARWKQIAHQSSAGCSHRCRDCGHPYTPKANESEDCPMCGSDGRTKEQQA